MRYRELKFTDLDMTRAVVKAWREEHPDGTAGELIAAVGGQFHRDWAPVLRGTLFAFDRHQARTVTGIIAEPAQAAR